MLGAAGALSSIAEEGAAFKAAKPDGCFVAGTAVAVSEGGAVLADVGTSSVHYKAIEDIRVNDVVVSRDVKTGKTENKQVLSLHKHLAHETITVALADASGKVVQSITATTEHPFYVEGKGMVSLSQLGIGTQIVTRAGPALTVKSAIRENHKQGVLVYNFEVEGDHTYFVGTAEGGAWVHNDSTSGFKRVGRWMSEGEYSAMVSSGTVEESVTGTTHIVTPADPGAFIRQAKPGSLYVEFNVPSSSVKPTQAGWGKIVGPNSLEGRLAARKGLPIPQMPSALNIIHMATKLARP